uniref:Glucagon like peptide 1 receptor n=1 Tax=Apteryx owenii TaxID=8824 RepID=A0A8B9PTR6_APTOW
MQWVSWAPVSQGAPAGAERAASAKFCDESLSGVMQKWKEYQLQCLKYLYEAPPIVAEGKFCNRTFDNYACWPDGLPGTYVNVSCPWYLPWANAVLHGQVYRFCTPEGTWLLKENSTLPWRNLSECDALWGAGSPGTMSRTREGFSKGFS